MVVCKFLGLICAGMLLSGAQAVNKAEDLKVPEPIKQIVVSGRNGNGLAMVEANQACVAWGSKAPFDPIEVQKALLPLAPQGNSKAMFFLGTSMIRYATPGSSSVVDSGKEWVRRAAESGYAPAMLLMVSYLPANAREEKNQWIKKAYATLLPKAKAGDVDAMLELQHIPDLLGDSKQPRRTLILISNREQIDWLRKATELGSIEAMIEGSDSLRQSMADSNEALLANRQESMVLSMKLAEMGHWPTMADLGAIYAIGCWPNSSWKSTDLGPDGQKLREDPKKAWEWWDKAIAIAGKDEVFKYLLEYQNIGDDTEYDCIPMPPRPTMH